MDVISKHKLYLICVCLCVNLIKCQPSALKKDPLDFFVVDESTMNNAPKSKDGLPRNVAVDFNVLGNPVKLNLKRIPNVQKAESGVHVIRKSKSGIPVIVDQVLQSQEVFGEYQDARNGAIFTITCPSGSNATSVEKCDATMEGTFRDGKEEYRMQLMDDKVNQRTKRSIASLWNKATDVLNAKSKVYGIFRTERSSTTATDFIEKNSLDNGIAPRAEALINNARTLRVNSLPGSQIYNVEVLAIIDYAIYKRFYDESVLGTEREKDNQAKVNVKKYFSHVFNGVDMMYKSIDQRDFTISVAISQFIIADSPEVSEWTDGGIGDGLNVVTALDDLIRWSFSARNVPKNDHIMLFTGLDVFSLEGRVKDPRTAGYARVGSICRLDSVSVVEDLGNFQCINAAAHELGHCLGARHDGSSGNNDCRPADQYVMTAHGGSSSASSKTNPWLFSKCSVEAFKKTIAKLPRGNCLKDDVQIYNKDEYIKFLELHPGQEKTPNEQCQAILGLDSYYGWGPELAAFEAICTDMACSTPGTSRTYNVYKAAPGTSCGDKKICISGHCKFDPQAPPKDPACVFGDTQRRFKSDRRGYQTCRERLLKLPMSCYDSFFSIRCCDTCDKLNTGVKDCEYGDHALNCRASQQCQFDSRYRRDCCSTCGLAPKPVLRELPQEPTKPVKPPTPVRPTAPEPANPFIPVRPVKPAKPQEPVRPVLPPKPVEPFQPFQPSKPISPPKPVNPANIPAIRPSLIDTRPPMTGIPVVPPPPFNPIQPVILPTFPARPLPDLPTGPPGPTELKPSGKAGLCLRMNARFLLVFKCSSLTSLMGPDACDNGLVSRYCCEKCPAPGTAACVDTPACKVRYARQCYVEANKKDCCRKCKRFWTGVQDCEYGDRIRSCERYLGGLGATKLCKSSYEKYCCGMCSAIGSRSVQDPTTNIIEVPKRGSTDTSFTIFGGKANNKPDSSGAHVIMNSGRRPKIHRQGLKQPKSTRRPNSGKRVRFVHNRRRFRGQPRVSSIEFLGTRHVFTGGRVPSKRTSRRQPGRSVVLASGVGNRRTDGRRTTVTRVIRRT